MATSRQPSTRLTRKWLVAGRIVHAPNPYNAGTFPPDNVQNFRYLGSAFRSLMQAVDGGADAAPSNDARAGYIKLSGMLDASLQKRSALKTTELSALNAKLKAAGKRPISLESRNTKS